MTLCHAGKERKLSYCDIDVDTGMLRIGGDAYQARRLVPPQNFAKLLYYRYYSFRTP